MGFAVIPIIFTISEDALSNVPRQPDRGSLALGASRWQTATRVVLPTASPGIFSAVMVGFGRAVGETMIVLMATGNTPILDWSSSTACARSRPTSRSRSPRRRTAARSTACCSSSALLLFVVTFVVNTAAELVRQRLRQTLPGDLTIGRAARARPFTRGDRLGLAHRRARSAMQPR